MQGLAILAIAAAALFAFGMKGNGAPKTPKAPGNGRPQPPTEAEAIEVAIEGGGTRDAMANAAYWLSHPECPRKLDPNDPAHSGCITIWKRLRKRIDDRLAGKKKAPKKPPPPVTPQDECDPLDPDTWGEGMLCFHDGERWKRVPEEQPVAPNAAIGRLRAAFKTVQANTVPGYKHVADNVCIVRYKDGRELVTPNETYRVIEERGDRPIVLAWLLEMWREAGSPMDMGRKTGPTALRAMKLTWPGCEFQGPRFPLSEVMEEEYKPASEYPILAANIDFYACLKEILQPGSSGSG